MMMNNSIEILAPCGSYDSVEAAVRQGADAVYIGSLQFSARAYAANFDRNQLEKAVRYCHLHGVKVHMAVNTLISDDELPTALKVAEDSYKLGVDAFIIQDLGLADIIKNACPEITLHASTQMGVHTPGAAKLLYSLGFERVVLAREMSRSEIEEVVKSCPVETEVFVHGALCMCMSGQCYLSAVIGSRSGNRGRCAQPCRLPFGVPNGTGHDLSLKDNCIIDELSELCKIGVTSAKIEGRMKRPEYVGAAAAACRHSADKGSADTAEIDRLKAVFSRSGFTSGYYYGKLGREMFGVRSKDDVVSATEKILSEIRTEYKDEIQTNPVNFTLMIFENTPSMLTAECFGHTVCVDGDIPQYARNVALSEDKCRTQLSKTGGTAFKVQTVNVQIGDGLTLPISSLNLMRREVLSQLEELITKVPDRKFIKQNITVPIPHRKQNKTSFRAIFRNCDIPECFKKCELVTVPLFSKISDIKSLVDRGFNIAVEIPRAFFGLENKVREKLSAVREIGITDVYCNNIGAVAAAKEMGFNIHGGFALNIFNTQAVNFYNNIGVNDTELSIELAANQINKIGGNGKIGIIGYGYLPVMITRNCPNKNGNGCKACGGKSYITDRKGNRFTLMCDSGCTELFNCNPLVLSDKQEQFRNIDFITLKFTSESSSECEKVFNDYLNKNKPHGEYTRGLYFRGVE